MHTITHPRAGMHPRAVTPAVVGAWLLALSFLALTSPLRAATLNVPSQYSTIQAAINAAANGDTVQLAAGTYTGSGNVDLDFGGKNITVNGSGAIVTIIDCAATSTSYHRAFNFHSGETGAQVRRLTIRRGYESSGGAISLASGCALTVTSCIFSTDLATGSGGRDCECKWGHDHDGELQLHQLPGRQQHGGRRCQQRQRNADELHPLQQYSFQRERRSHLQQFSTDPGILHPGLQQHKRHRNTGRRIGK